MLDDLQILEESKTKGTMKVRGTFQRAEESNANNRVYPKTVLEGQVGKLQPLISERRLCGELDHPQSDTVRLSNASHLVTKLWMEDNEVYGEAEILNTPAGKVAQALIQDGVKIGISSRGLGTLSEGLYGTKYKTVNDDYKLVTFDLVADPSTQGAHPSLSESLIHTEARYKRTLDQAISEKVFVTLLNNKLHEAQEGRDRKHKARTTQKKHIVDLGDLVPNAGDTDYSRTDEGMLKKMVYRVGRRVHRSGEMKTFDADPKTREKGEKRKKLGIAISRRGTKPERYVEGQRRRVTRRDLGASKRRLLSTLQKRIEYERTLDASGNGEKTEESYSSFSEASYDRLPRHRLAVRRSETPSKTDPNSALMKWLRGEDWRKGGKSKKKKKS